MSISSAEAFPECPRAEPDSPMTDVTWLLHRAAQRLRHELDFKARHAGLTGIRDWIVLTTINDGQPRTQLNIGYELGLDKTTLASVLDRLEAGGFIIRTTDPEDRRARLPQITNAGRETQLAVAKERDDVQERVLAEFSDTKREVFLTILRSLAGLDDTSDDVSRGSCM